MTEIYGVTVKNIVITLVLVAIFSTPAEASAWSRIKQRITMRNVLGAPFWAVGFGVTLLTDVTVVPLYKGARHYIDAPAIKGW